jgi:hypothetical protein
MRRVTGPLVLVLAGAVAAAGCGGGDGTSDTATAAPTVTTLQATTTQPAPAPRRPDALDRTAQRLRSGGYAVSRLEVNPPAIAARKVGEHVLLYAYKSAAAAQAGAGVIRSAISEHPKRGALDTEGARVYFFGDQQDLTAKERASFADLVDVGEGRTSP